MTELHTRALRQKRLIDQILEKVKDKKNSPFGDLLTQIFEVISAQQYQIVELAEQNKELV